MKNIFLILLVALVSFSSCKKCETCRQHVFITNHSFVNLVNTDRFIMDGEPIQTREVCGKELKEISQIEEEKAYNQYGGEYYIVRFWICEPEN